MVGKGMWQVQHDSRSSCAERRRHQGLAAPTALADPPQGHRIPERLVSSERSAGVGNLRSLEDGVGSPGRPRWRAHAGCERGAAQPPVTVSHDEFRWGDAMIGAAVAAGVLLMAGALMVMVRQRRRIALS